MSHLEHLDSAGQSAESLWPMYKNAKNLLPYRYRMENLIWRMMYVKSRTRLSKDAARAKLELSSFMQTPFLSQMVDKSSSVDRAKDDFNYVAHIRKMSESVSQHVPNRKRPAPMSPFMTHAPHQDSFNGIVRPSIHSNFSAAFKGKSPDYMGNEDHGYSFQLDSFTLEGPQQSDVNSHQDQSFSHQYFGGKSLPSTLPYMPTSALHGTHGSGASVTDSHSPHFTSNPNSFSTIPSTAPQSIGVPQNPHFPTNKRKTPSSSYDPSSFMYPTGPASILSDPIIKQENSLVSVADHFASSSRPYTPYEFDDQTSVADSYFPGMLNKDTLPSNTPQRGSSAGPRMYDEPDPKLTFFDNNGQGNSANLFQQKQKLPYQNFQDDKKERNTNFWIDDYFNDSSSPHGSVSTTNSGTNPGLNRVASLSKKKGNKPIKGKKPTKSDKPGAMEDTMPSMDMKSDARPMLSKQNSKKSVPQSNSKTPSLNGNIECTNCFTKTTPLWRRNPQGEPLCNACGLFLKLHGTVRPLSLKTDVIKKRQRGQSSSQSTRKTSSAGGTANQKGTTKGGEKDGDDFSPAPIGKTKASFSGKSQAQQSQQSQPKETVEESRANSAGGPSPNAEMLHSINELVKDEWNPVEQDTAMYDGSMAESKGQWDWLSMNI